jgi:hypothetical protein
VTRRFVCVLAVVLTACASGNTPQAECERQAAQDPKVQEIYSRTNGDYTMMGYLAHDDLIQAKRLAVLRCMREKGLAAPGGVEPVAPRLQCATCSR